MSVLIILIATLFGTYGYAKDLKGEIESKQCHEDICWGKGNYPDKDINTMFHKLGYNQETFGGNVRVVENSSFVEPSCNLCHYISSSFAPTMVKDKKGNDYYVVQTEVYKQYITLNICKPPAEQGDSPCNTMKPKLLNEERECKQKTSTIKLLVYDQINNKFEGKSFQYASACVCTFKKI